MKQRLKLFLLINIFFIMVVSCKTTSDNTHKSSQLKTIDEVQVDRNKKIILEIMITLIESSLKEEGLSPEKIMTLGIDRAKIGNEQFDRDLRVRKHPGTLLLVDGAAAFAGLFVSAIGEGAIRDIVDERVFYWRDSKDNEHSASFTIEKHKLFNMEGSINILLNHIWIDGGEKITHPKKAVFLL